MTNSLPCWRPSLLLSCGSKAEAFSCFSDGCICELSGEHLRVTNSQGETEYIKLGGDPATDAEQPTGAHQGVFVSCTSYDKRKLLAVGASGIEGEVLLLQLSCIPLKRIWRQRITAASPVEIVSLDFSPCGGRLFCLSSTLEQGNGQQGHVITTHHVNVLNASDGSIQACHTLQWDDFASFPKRVLAASGTIFAVLSDTNLTTLQLVDSPECRFITSGNLLPQMSGAAAGLERVVTISGACWVAAGKKGTDDNNCSNFLFLAFSNKVFLAIGVGCKDPGAPFLAWISSSQEKYVSLATEDETGVLFGLTDSSVLHSYKINERLAEALSQNAGESRAKELRFHLAQLQQDHDTQSLTAAKGRSQISTPDSGTFGPLVLLQHQIRIEIPISKSSSEGTTLSKALGSLRLPSSRSSELAPLLISDTAGCVWNLSKERCIQTEVDKTWGDVQVGEKDPAVDDSDGEDRNDTASMLALAGTSFGGVVGLTLTIDGCAPHQMCLRLTTAHASGRIMGWLVSVEKTGKSMKVSPTLQHSSIIQQSISCLGYMMDFETGNERNLEELHENQCLLGLVGGSVVWLENGSIRPVCRFSSGTIRCIVGIKIKGMPSLAPSSSCMHSTEVDDEGGDTAWAAVCSSGEVAFFLGPERTETNTPTTVLKRLFLSSWLDGNTADSPLIKGHVPPATLRIPENGGCWVKRGVELWREFQQEDEQPTSYAGTLVGVFSVAFSTASFGAPVSGIALLIPRVDSEELASFPQIRCTRLSVSPLCIASEGPFLAVGTASGGVVLFHLRDVFGESCSGARAFVAAPAITPLTYVSIGCLPIQRVQLLWDISETTKETANEKHFAIVERPILVLALQADGQFLRALFQPELLGSPASLSLLVDKNAQYKTLANKCNVCAVAPCISSWGIHHARLSLTIATAKGQVAVATLREPGLFQLWVLENCIGQLEPHACSDETEQATSFRVEFSCSTVSNRASPEGKLLQDLDGLKEAHDDPSNSQLLPKKSRLYTARRLSAAPDVQAQMEAIMREKQAIQEELQTLVERVTGSDALRSLEAEAANVDASVRMIVNQQAIATQMEKQQQLLLLQHAFFAFHRSLVQHLQASILTAPKELAIPAEKPGSVITEKSYLRFRQRPRDTILETKFIFLRKLQLKEDEWLRQLLPSHESMLQMQQEDLTPPIGGFGKSAQRYLAFYHSLDETQDCSEATRPSVESAVAPQTPPDGAGTASRRQVIYSQEPLKNLSGLLKMPFLIATNASRRIQFWVLRAILAELQTSFNRRLEECSSTVLRKIDKMQQLATKARECAAHIGEANDQSGPELSVPLTEDTVKDLANALVGAPKTADMPGLTKGGQGTLLPGEAVHPTDEAAQRALQRMMGGRLKAEDALSALELQADKWEAWMRSVTPGTMTDAQAAKFAAYQEQLTALKEKQGALREKIQGELKKMRDELTSTAAQLRADLFNLKDWKRVYEEELLLTELASARLTDSIAQEAANETAEAEIQSRLENSTAQVQQLHQELQKQQGSCWLLDDERAAAQHDQKTKATALLAALGLVHVPSETLAAINKKLNDAAAMDEAQRLRKPAETQEEPEQALRRECAALSYRLDTATDALKAELSASPDTSLCKVLEASRDSIFAQQRLVLAMEAADAEQRKLTSIKQRLEEHQAAATALRLQLNISSEALEQSRLDVDLLLRVKRGTVGELPDAVAPLHEPFDFSDSCLVSQEAVDAYKRDIISGGRQKLKLLEAMKALRRQVESLQWRTRLLELEAIDVSERTKDVHLLRITRSMQRILQMPGGSVSTARARNSNKEQSGSAAGPSSQNWASQVPADALKDTQKGDKEVESLEEAKVKLKKKMAAVLAEIKQRETAIKRMEGQLQRVEQNRDFKQRVVVLRRAQDHQSNLRAAGKMRALTWEPADQIRVLSRMQARILEKEELINSLKAELNRLRERNVIFFQDAPEIGPLSHKSGPAK